MHATDLHRILVKDKITYPATACPDTDLVVISNNYV